MIWLQAGLCFLIWIAYGFRLRGLAPQLRERMRTASSGRRVAIGSAGLLLGLALLLAGLYGLAAAGAVAGGTLTWWGWIGCAAIGLVFIHMQVLGAAAMITLIMEQETASTGGTSVPKENL